MRQLTQNLKDGKMELLEVPFPAVREGYVLVRNHYSVISAGTEGKIVKDARAGYIEKAKSREKEVKQVIDSIKTDGLVQTYNMVMNKLEAPSPLGYSCAGDVVGIGYKGIPIGSGQVREGDLVACGGATANHSEVVSIPVNLCAKVPAVLDLRHAAFMTVGTIAMQGIRQSDLRIGENCVVIGLGLIGQLTMQILNAGGIFPIGIDIENNQVDLANKVGIGKSFNRNKEDIEQTIFEIANGYGTDAVIITAGTSSLDPVELAGRLCRKKGRVVIVGAVPTGFSRECYYKKELELKMSSSYGPGRYHADYEEKGLDYPIGYVRWTENRNMQAFIDLLYNKKLNLEPLITHQFNFEEAPKAYDLIVNKTEPYTGIILKYNIEKEISKPVPKLFQDQKSQPEADHPTAEEVRLSETDHTIIQPVPRSFSEDRSFNHSISVRVGFIGAGSFAQNFLLPNIIHLIKQQKIHKVKVELIGVATARSTTSKHIADKYGFKYATCEADEIINDQNINTVFIATRHNLHAEYVIKALNAGKNVFVEKPLAMNEEQLEKVCEVYHTSIQSYNHAPILMVGYNRRFAPHIKRLKELLSDDLPKAINYRINAGALPKDHWIQDPDIGGGRIIGEVCHFIDLCMFIASSSIISIQAESLDAKPDLMDTVIINLKFKNGCVASISYFSNGSKKLPKEYIEVFQGGRSFIINDFKEMRVYGKKKENVKLNGKLWFSKKQDKGHAEEIKSFIHSINPGEAERSRIIHSLPSPIPFEELSMTSQAAFKVIESIQKREVIKLSTTSV